MTGVTGSVCSSVLSFLPATCARLSRFKLHHQSQLVWSGKLSQPIKAGSSAWDGWWCLSTGQPDSSEDNASMQQVNSVTPSPAHDWRLSHRCFVPACLERKPRDAPLIMLVASFMTIDHPSLAGHPHHSESQPQPACQASRIARSARAAPHSPLYEALKRCTSRHAIPVMRERFSWPGR